MSIVSPDYKVPSRKSVCTRIKQRHDIESELFINLFKDVTSAAITTDTSTSVSTDSFITLTEHHISDSWKLTSNVLMSEPRNPAKNSQVSEFNFTDKVEVFVHDNARNIVSAGILCSGWDDL